MSVRLLNSCSMAHFRITHSVEQSSYQGHFFFLKVVQHVEKMMIN